MYRFIFWDRVRFTRSVGDILRGPYPPYNFNDMILLKTVLGEFDPEMGRTKDQYDHAKVLRVEIKA